MQDESLCGIVAENIGDWLKFQGIECVEIRVKRSRPGWNRNLSYKNHFTLYVPVEDIPRILSLPEEAGGDDRICTTPSAIQVSFNHHFIRFDEEAEWYEPDMETPYEENEALWEELRSIFGVIDDDEGLNSQRIPPKYLTFEGKRPSGRVIHIIL